jgi:hypothetical protein
MGCSEISPAGWLLMGVFRMFPDRMAMDGSDPNVPLQDGLDVSVPSVSDRMALNRVFRRFPDRMTIDWGVPNALAGWLCMGVFRMFPDGMAMDWKIPDVL